MPFIWAIFVFFFQKESVGIDHCLCFQWIHWFCVNIFSCHLLIFKIMGKKGLRLEGLGGSYVGVLKHSPLLWYLLVFRKTDLIGNAFWECYEFFKFLANTEHIRDACRRRLSLIALLWIFWYMPSFVDVGLDWYSSCGCLHKNIYIFVFHWISFCNENWYKRYRKFSL